jgi:hypothetical protein
MIEKDEIVTLRSLVERCLRPQVSSNVDWLVCLFIVCCIIMVEIDKS